jgi:hypothetical protein
MISVRGCRLDQLVNERLQGWLALCRRRSGLIVGAPILRRDRRPAPPHHQARPVLAGLSDPILVRAQLLPRGSPSDRPRKPQPPDPASQPSPTRWTPTAESTGSQTSHSDAIERRDRDRSGVLIEPTLARSVNTGLPVPPETSSPQLKEPARRPARPSSNDRFTALQGISEAPVRIPGSSCAETVPGRRVAGAAQ